MILNLGIQDHSILTAYLNGLIIIRTKVKTTFKWEPVVLLKFIFQVERNEGYFGGRT